MLPMAVARSSSSRVTKFQGGGAVLGVFFPTDNALYSIAFGNHKNGWTDRDAILDDEWACPEEQCVGYDPRRGRGSFGGGRAWQA